MKRVVISLRISWDFAWVTLPVFVQILCLFLHWILPRVRLIPARDKSRPISFWFTFCSGNISCG